MGVGGWGPEIAFLERIEKPVHKNGPPLMMAIANCNSGVKLKIHVTAVFNVKLKIIYFSRFFDGPNGGPEFSPTGMGGRIRLGGIICINDITLLKQTNNALDSVCF